MTIISKKDKSANFSFEDKEYTLPFFFSLITLYSGDINRDGVPDFIVCDESSNSLNTKLLLSEIVEGTFNYQIEAERWVTN